MARSDADEGLQQPSKETLQHDVALQGDQTNAGRAFFNARIVLDILIGFIEIAGTEATAFMREGAFEHAGPFRADMTMARKVDSRCSLQHENAKMVFDGDAHRAPLHATADPAPGAKLVS